MPARRGKTYMQNKSDNYHYVRSTKSNKILASMTPYGEKRGRRKYFGLFTAVKMHPKKHLKMHGKHRRR